MYDAGNLQQLYIMQVAYNYVWCRKLTTVMYGAGSLQQLCRVQVAYYCNLWCRYHTTLV